MRVLRTPRSPGRALQARIPHRQQGRDFNCQKNTASQGLRRERRDEIHPVNLELLVVESRLDDPYTSTSRITIISTQTLNRRSAWRLTLRISSSTNGIAK